MLTTCSMHSMFTTTLFFKQKYAIPYIIVYNSVFFRDEKVYLPPFHLHIQVSFKSPTRVTYMTYIHLQRNNRDSQSVYL